MLRTDSRISKNERVPWRLIEEEAILVNIDTQEAIHLNEVATKIWDAIDGKKTPEDIIKHIQNQFEVEERKAQEDTLKFLEELLKQGLIHAC